MMCEISKRYKNGASAGNMRHGHADIESLEAKNWCKLQRRLAGALTRMATISRTDIVKVCLELKEIEGKSKDGNNGAALILGSTKGQLKIL